MEFQILAGESENRGTGKEGKGKPGKKVKGEKGNWAKEPVPLFPCVPLSL